MHDVAAAAPAGRHFKFRWPRPLSIIALLATMALLYILLAIHRAAKSERGRVPCTGCANGCVCPKNPDTGRCKCPW